MNHLRRSKAFERMVHSESGFYPARSIIDGTKRHVPAGAGHAADRRRRAGRARRAGEHHAPVVDGRRVRHRDQRILLRGGLAAGVCAARHLRKQTLLTDLTRTDPLTGLCNRRALDIALADEWERLQRGSNGSLSILFIDADHFKQYNDRHGHAEGDTALRFRRMHPHPHAAARRSRRALRRRGVRRGAAGHRRKRPRRSRRRFAAKSNATGSTGSRKPCRPSPSASAARPAIARVPVRARAVASGGHGALSCEARRPEPRVARKPSNTLAWPDRPRIASAFFGSGTYANDCLGKRSRIVHGPIR